MIDHAMISHHYRSDNCECNLKVAELADLFRNFIHTKKEATNLKATATPPATTCSRPNCCASVATQIIGHHATAHNETQNLEYTADRGLGKVRHSAQVVLM
jgi:methionine aminopeptidase